MGLRNAIDALGRQLGDTFAWGLYGRRIRQQAIEETDSHPSLTLCPLALPYTRIQGWTNQLPPCSVTAWSTRTRYYRRFVRRSRKLASSGLWRTRR